MATFLKICCSSCFPPGFDEKEAASGLCYMLVDVGETELQRHNLSFINELWQLRAQISAMICLITFRQWMKVFLKWKWSFSFSRTCLHSYRFWKTWFYFQGLFAFYEILLGPGAQKRFQWRTKHVNKNWEKEQQPSHLIASIWSYGFLKEIRFFLQASWSLNHLLNQWRCFWLLFCHKTKASKIQPLDLWSAAKAHRSRSESTSSRCKDVFEMSEDEEDACVGPKVAAVSKPRHMKPWGIINLTSIYQKDRVLRLRTPCFMFDAVPKK